MIKIKATVGSGIITSLNTQHMKSILIAGGTGLVGKHLSKTLVEKGYQVSHLSRRENLQAKYPAYRWDLKEKFIDPKAIKQADIIINLAGSNIGEGRWTKASKKIAIDSRVIGNELLHQYVKQHQPNLEAFIAASAMGYYGDREDEILGEDSPAGSGGFLVECCTLWEKAIHSFDDTNIRTIIFRIPLVLSTQGGALSKMLPSYQFGLGAFFGDGQQWYSWVHPEDISNMFITAIENKNWSGTFNAGTPNPVRNKEMAVAIKKALNKFALVLPAPALFLKIGLGEMSSSVLGSTRLSAKKILDAGFKFQHPELVPALQDIIKRKL